MRNDANVTREAGGPQEWAAIPQGVNLWLLGSMGRSGVIQANPGHIQYIGFKTVVLEIVT